jgi:neuroligin
MYVWAHNSDAGEHATISQSVHGEDLPYVFGAPLMMFTGPFQSHYTSEERLLSEATMQYFTNFAKTGKPTLLWSGRFNNMNPIDWKKYNIHWQEFNEINQNYLLLGIPPIVSQRYRHRYTKFWNDGLVEMMKNVENSVSPFGKFLNTPPTPRKSPLPFPTGQVISMYPIQVEIDGEPDDPIRELKRKLNANTQQMSTSTESINFSEMSSNEQEIPIFKSDTTMFFLISVIVAFLFVNLAGVLIYLYRRAKKLNRKYDDSSNMYDDDKRSKFNDTDDSFILRKSNNTYESVKRHSPINGYGITRQMSTSTSTVDTNVKVMGWMTKENGQVIKYNIKYGGCKITVEHQKHSFGG